MKKVYSYEEARTASTEYFKGDTLAADVFIGKYALQDLQGNILESTPTDMHRRLAKEFARIESNYPDSMSEEEIFGLFSSWEVVPQGSPMSAVGNPYQTQSLSNCFVIESPYDSYGGILKTDQEEVQIMKRRGGVGFDISTIRPKGMTAANAARTTDGLGVFMERFSNTCREVAQGGRRGALMLTLSIHHPEIKTFVNIKRDTTKVTGANISVRVSDEFMNAVKNGEKYQMRFPVEKDVPHLFEEWVDAREVWDNIVSAARDCSEPGILFWDTVERTSPADAYEAYKSTSTNPCLTYETKVAVADGRGHVEIGKLAEEGYDVPVYARSDSGEVIIRTMRNPRITGYKVPVYKVTLEGGHSFRATGNHKLLLATGEYKQVKNLQTGDPLNIMTRQLAKFSEILPSLRATTSQDYVWVSNTDKKKPIGEHRIIWKEIKGCIPNDHVIHHIDYDAQNNHIDNLQCMSHADHVELHRKDMLGDKNPMRRAQTEWSDEKWQTYHNNMSASVSGLLNGRAYAEVSNEQLFEHAVKLCLELGSGFSHATWSDYAKQHNLPQFLVEFRFGEHKTFNEWSRTAALQAGVTEDIVDLDPRLQRTVAKARNMGYEVQLRNSDVFVKRSCEWCAKAYFIRFDQREISFCGNSCSQLYANRKAGKNIKRAASNRATHIAKAEKTRKIQLDAFTALRLEHGRDPIFNEWAAKCKEIGSPSRIGTEFGFKTWPELKKSASLHNHRVVNVELDGVEDVYNGTVDEVHNFYMGCWEEKSDLGKKKLIDINNLQCGEITLSTYDACRLLLVNLEKFVSNPFTKDALFDFKKFKIVAYKAQKLMDDLVDLELEAIDKILAKIDLDPEPDDVKALEKNLWTKISAATSGGRRTGLGITALGDAIASMNLKYGSDESIKLTERIYKELCLASYASSIKMAQVRGAFPVYDLEVEKDHPFLKQVISELDHELREKYELFGRRNIANTTTAPAGSLSILTQTTSGCEPVLWIEATRRKKINPNDKQARVDFTDALGDRWQEYDTFHHGFSKWMAVTGLTKKEVQQSPYWGSTVEEIDWLKKIDIQAAAQKWVCHSISNTTNLPEDVSIDTVKDLYWHAWQTGCKGVTIYRKGSRSGVILDKNAKIETTEDGQPVVITETHAPKRPKELECDIHRVNIKGESYLAVVGLYHDRPYEVFAGLSSHVEVPKKMKKGRLVKNGKKEGVATYNLVLPLDDDELIFKDIVNLFDNPEHGAITRMISLSIRHGVPMNYLVEQLKKDKHSDLQSFSFTIARVLKGYIKDGSGVTTEKTCAQCSATTLVYQQGCVSCTSCGWSKC